MKNSGTRLKLLNGSGSTTGSCLPNATKATRPSSGSTWKTSRTERPLTTARPGQRAMRQPTGMRPPKMRKCYSGRKSGCADHHRRGRAARRNDVLVGGNLRGVVKNPIRLTHPGKLVYSPHEYSRRCFSSRGSSKPEKHDGNMG